MRILASIIAVIVCGFIIHPILGTAFAALVVGFTVRIALQHKRACTKGTSLITYKG